MKRKVAPQKRLVALVLCYIVGVVGGHRFYVGKTTSAIFQILTLGGLGVWTLIDMILILFGEFTNDKGEFLVEWT